MNRDQKAAVSTRSPGEIEAADAIFAVDYRGITVAQMAELRAQAARSRHQASGSSRTRCPSAPPTRPAPSRLKPMLGGPTALALVGGDAALAAKALNDTARALRDRWSSRAA